jgi:hypothetical protein
MDWIVQLIMNYRILLLVFLLCIVAVPAMTASGNYMGGDVVLGGSGPGTLKITEITTAVTQAAASVPPAVQPVTGSLSVTTSPAGATIAIDGVQRGVSPATIPGLAPGTHTLLLKRDGYQDLSAAVTISAGQTQTYTTGLSPASTQLPALPAATRSPGFEAVLGFAAVGAVLLLKQTFR